MMKKHAVLNVVVVLSQPMSKPTMGKGGRGAM